MIDKGRISTISEDGKTATVVPDFDGVSVTFPLVVPFFLLGCLSVKMPVVYATFPDNTGVILCRMDGEWSRKINGIVQVEDLKTSMVASVNGHTHTYSNDTGTSNTSKPN